MKITLIASVLFAVLMSDSGIFATPIHEWAKLGKLDKIKQLESLHAKQKKVINWNEKNEIGQTPLMLAASEGHDSTVIYLLERNADPAIRDSKGKTAFDYAKNDRIKSILNKQSQAHERPTIQTISASGLNEKDQKKQVEKSGSQHFDPVVLQAELTSAACKGNLEEVIEVVKKGAQVNAPDNNVNTPLTAAIKCYQMPLNGHNHLAVIDYLLSHGASILIHDKDGKNALHYATEYENNHIVNRLINSLQNDPNKAEIINAQDRNGDTPLHYAAATSSFDLIKTLLKNGAHKDMQNNAGKYPLDVLGTKRSTSEINRQNMAKNSIEILQLLSLQSSTPQRTSTIQPRSPAAGSARTTNEFSANGRSRTVSVMVKPPRDYASAAPQISDEKRAKESWGKPGIVTFDAQTGDTHIEVPASDDESDNENENNHR